MRLFDICRKQQALKLGWINKLNDPFFRGRFFQSVSLPDLPFTLECNLSPKHAKALVKKHCFWGEVLIHWCKFNFAEPQNSQEIANEVIWFNSHITTDGKTWFKEECITQGITWLKDLLNPDGDGEFFQYMELRQRYDCKIDWLTYSRLIESIPHRWRNSLTEGVILTENEVSSNHTLVCNSEKPANVIYKSLISRGEPLNKYKARWEEKYDIILDDEEYLQSFQQLYKLTNITKYRDFQYRLLLGKIPTNKDLKHWKLSNNDTCTFCNENEESIMHLLHSCQFSMRVLKFVLRLIKRAGLPISFKELLLNNATMSKIGKELLMLYKQYIYRCCCQTKKPNIQSIKQEILLLYNTHKYLAKRNGTLIKLKQKWVPVDFNLLFT